MEEGIELSKFTGWLPQSGSVEISAWVTAFATVSLAFLTLALVVATTRMVKEMSKPNVIANLESNTWSLIHMDMVVENTGNAPAYDISVELTPPMPRTENDPNRVWPFSAISLLRPGQSLKSSVAEWSAVKDQTYTVKIGWRRFPSIRKREQITYELDVSNLGGITMLGSPDPTIQIADQIKKLRDDWRLIASGQRKLKSDSFSQSDRDAEQKRQEEWRDEMIRRQESQSGPSENDSMATKMRSYLTRQSARLIRHFKIKRD